ncbi:hypothetical protein HYX70_01770, partial [Candidatus Saccharibacteria bacterium]|nr:hypothetical protein [Candidatus Saccharibacteria bacterium]
LATKVTGDSNNRYQLLANGTMQWGPGNAAADTFMLRDSAAGTLAVQPSASATPAQGLVKVYATGSTGSILNLRVSGGTIASPTATPTGTNGIGTMAFHGYTGAAYSAGTSGLVGYQTQTWTGSAQGADIFFYVTANNTTSTSFKRQPPAKISSAGLSIGAVGAAGNNEKLKVNPHTTIDNNAVVILNPSATTVKGAVVQAVGGQSVNIQGWQDSNGVAMSAIDSTGQLVLGNTSGQAGSVTFVNGSGSTNTALATATLSASRIITLPNETGTVCLQSSSSCGFAIGSGTAFLQGGNSFGTIASLGTIDTTTSSCIGTCGQPLSIKTANTTYITTQSDVLNTTFNCTNSAAQLCQLVGQNGATISIKGAGTNSEHFGASSASAGNSGLAFGNSASAGFASSIAIGFGASTTAANQLVVGDSTNGSTTNAITSVFIGAGVTNSSPGLGINYSATGGGGSSCWR